MNRALIRLVILLPLLAGCLGPTIVQQTGSLVPDTHRVVVIGKFELIPPLDPELEQELSWNVIGGDRIINKLFIATGNSAATANPGLVGNDWSQTIETEWGKPFQVELRRGDTWIKGAVTQLNVMHQDRLWFPGNASFKVPEGTDAIYIGTMKYYRNDFNEVLSTAVQDDRRLTLKELGLEDSKDIKTSLIKLHAL